MIILNNNSNINKLYHISDIHIRRYDRHAEYELVFNNLYNYLTNVSNVNSLNNQLIIITGDLLHAKDNLTPDCVVKCYKFLKSLADIMPVILIAGNHDMVETNKNIKDSIDAILSERNIDNLYYLQKSGIYKYGNIIFGASSLLDNQFIKANEINNINNELLIGLYHGPVGACSTAVGVVLHGDKQVDDFIGYDYVLLGDIHKFQYMNKEKTIAYASSLISQNFAEIDDNHGILVWDLDNKTSHYQIIDNPYRYMRVDIVGGNVIYNDINIDYNIYLFPTNARIRLNIIETSKELCEQIKKTIRKRYPHILFQEIFQKNILNKNNTIENVNKDFDYKEMMKEYLVNMNQEDYDECQKIFMKDLEGMNLKMDRQLCQWEFLDLEFSNLFVYGENNKIDFTKLPMNDIVGLFAPNSYGKSSFIDIILFSLYDNFSRNAVNKHRTIPSYIVNNNCNWFESKIRFKLGDDIYCVHKKGTLKGKAKSKTGKAISFDIYNFSKNNQNIGRKDRFETLEEISKIIGSYDDFCLTSLFLQNKERNFYEMSSTDRKSFLYNMFNLDKFEGMYDIYKNEEKTYKTLKDDIESKLVGCDIDTILDNVLIDKKKIKKINIKIDKLNKTKGQINSKKNKLIYLLNNDIMNKFDNSLDISHLEWLKKNYDICEEIINNNPIIEYNNQDYYINLVKDLLNKNMMNIEIYHDINKVIKTLKEHELYLSNINEDDIKSNYQKYMETINKKEKLEYKLNIVNDYIKNNTINENCKECIKRTQILNNYIQEQKTIKLELIDIDINDDFKMEYDKLEYVKSNYNIMKNCYNTYKRNLCKDILEFYKKYDEYYKSDYNILNKFIIYREYLKINIECLMNLENIKLIKKYDSKLNIIDEKLNYYNNMIHEYKYNLGINETKYNEYNQMKNDIKNIINKYNIYNVLKKIAHINGVPSKIISMQLENIENMINNIISPFINKKITINLDGNFININIIDNQSNIINILGGMEMFIINIGFKISLSSLSLLPKNKLLIIDEGVSVLDKQHIEQFDKIILFLNQHYENVILISHIDSLKDFISQYIHITKNNNNYSNILY